MPDDEFGSVLKKQAYADSNAMSQDMQTIPARHGTATFVPSGSVIKIVNTSGTQVIDTWAFALPTPPKKGGEEKEAPKKDEKKEEPKEEKPKEEEKKPAETPKPTPKKGKGRKDRDMGLPSQEEAEQATSQFNAQQEVAEKDGATPKKSGWSSYIPSVPTLRGKAAPTDEEKAKDAQTKENSRSWGQYFSAGQGFSSYIPGAKSSVSAFTSSHNRDPNKSYIEQLSDFSKTPVGAAGISALSGSGYASSLYAGYSAWNSTNAPNEPAMEFLSMPHTRAATLHIIPKANDTLVSNLREPMLTLLEDSSPGIHDTLIAACDPQRYHGLGVEDWLSHGSCAENLVLALKELNEKAGLKGAKGIGADVTVNAVPAPLNLFMNIPWAGDKGELDFAAPAGKKGDYVRFKAERDVVVVMSACPQDVLDINGKDPQDGHFFVEESMSAEDEETKRKLEAAEKRKKRPPPKKLNGTGAAKKPAAATGKGAASGGPAKSTPAKATPAKKAVPTAKKPSAPAAKPAAPKADAAKTPAKTPEAPKADAPKAEAPKTDEAADTAGAVSEAKPPVEKKKPKKLQKRGSVQTDAKSVTTDAKSEAGNKGEDIKESKDES